MSREEQAVGVTPVTSIVECRLIYRYSASNTCPLRLMLREKVLYSVYASNLLLFLPDSTKCSLWHTKMYHFNSPIFHAV